MKAFHGHHRLFTLHPASGSQLYSIAVRDQQLARPWPGKTDTAGQFYDVEAWGSLAALYVDRLRKGSRVAISGQAVWQGYANASGDAHKALRVINPSITLLDSKAERQALAATASTAQGSGVAHTASSQVGAPFSGGKSVAVTNGSRESPGRRGAPGLKRCPELMAPVMAKGTKSL